MRRLVRHGLAGVGAATFAVVAGVTALGAPATTTLAEPATSIAPQSVLAPVLAPDPPVDPAVEAQRAASAARENRDAERTRIAQAVVNAATQRASNLDTQGDVIDRTSKDIKAARATAKAEAEARAKARAAAAEKERRDAIKSEGYEAGVTDPREMARQILDNKFDYGSDQFSCFDWIITRESNWNVRATNPSSGAYGLPQSLPGSKMASVASDWRDNPATQILWAAKYMKDRYGSPCDAKSYWQRAGNY